MDFDSLVQLYIENKSSDCKVTLDIIEKMKVIGNGNDFIKFRVLYYEAHFLYEQGLIEKSLVLIVKVIKHLLYYNYCTELGKCYLLMGTIYMNKGDNMQGVDCFLSAKELSENHHDLYVSSGVYSCLGCIYDQLIDYNKAIECFQKAFDISNKLSPKKKSHLLESTNLALIYCRSNNFQKAKLYFNLSLTYYSTSQLDKYFINLFVVKCYIANHDNDIKELKFAINEIIKWIQDDLIDINGFQEVLRVIPILLKNDTLNLIKKLLSLLHVKAEELNIMDIRIAVVSAKLMYYKFINNELKINETSIRFYELSLQKENKNKRDLLEGVNVKIELQRVIKLQKETQISSNIYKEKAERDELTGLFNRTMLKNSYEILFQEAKQRRISIGLIIFDMDSFKQYNDYFGHVAGDKCIRDVTGVMHRLCDERIMFLRYGGDEFLGFFYHYNEVEIRSFSNLIQAEVRALNIEHPKSNANEKIVSITQGGYISIPEGDETLYDFIRKADEALYEGKNKKEVIVIHTKS